MIYQPGYTSVQGNTSTSLEKWDLQIQACQPEAAGNLFGNNEYAAQLIQRETGGSGRRRCKSCLANKKDTRRDVSCQTFLKKGTHGLSNSPQG